jgi:DNA primase
MTTVTPEASAIVDRYWPGESAKAAADMQTNMALAQQELIRLHLPSMNVKTLLRADRTMIYLDRVISGDASAVW